MICSSSFYLIRGKTFSEIVPQQSNLSKSTENKDCPINKPDFFDEKCVEVFQTMENVQFIGEVKRLSTSEKRGFCCFQQKVKYTIPANSTISSSHIPEERESFCVVTFHPLYLIAPIAVINDKELKTCD
ncbi:hypothetical protein ABK040_006287 [Willaertia magna]